MKQRTTAAFLLALGLVTLAGCSTPSVITLNDGREIQTVDRPDFCLLYTSDAADE